MISDNLAIFEMLVVFAAVAAFSIYQIQSVRGPWKETNPRRGSKSTRHPAPKRKSRRR